jgi:hypothetical protein
MRHLLIFVAALSCAAAGWPILRAAKGGGAIRLGGRGGWPILHAAKGGGAIRLGGRAKARRCAAEATEQRSPVASALHRRRGDAIRREF